jgi:hypothetical protein
MCQNCPRADWVLLPGVLGRVIWRMVESDFVVDDCPASRYFYGRAFQDGRWQIREGGTMPSLVDVGLLSTYAQLERQDEGSDFRDLEAVVHTGNELFRAISLVDQNWHTEMYEGRTPYDEADEVEIAGYYRTWLHTGDRVLEAIEEQEARGRSVAGAEEFRKNRREAQGLLVDDAAFFGGDALAELRDEAIDDHRAGRTVDFHVLGE